MQGSGGDTKFSIKKWEAVALWSWGQKSINKEFNKLFRCPC